MNESTIYIIVFIVIIILIIIYYAYKIDTSNTNFSIYVLPPQIVNGVPGGYVPGDCPLSLEQYYIPNYLANSNVTGQNSTCTYAVYDVIISRYTIFGGNPSQPFMEGLPNASFPQQMPTYKLIDTNSLQFYDSHILVPVGPNTGLYAVSEYSVVQNGNANIAIDTSYLTSCTALNPNNCAFVPSYGTFNNNSMASPLMMWKNGNTSNNNLHNPYLDPTGNTNYLQQTLVINKFTLKIANVLPNNPMAIMIATSGAGSINAVGIFYVIPPIANFILNVHIGN